jgi:hypothetical protein
MIDILFLGGLLCAAMAALRYRSKPAVILLISAAVGSTLAMVGMPFDPLLWFSVTLVFALSIMWMPHNLAEMLIVPLYIPIWILYFFGGSPNDIAGTVSLIATAQMLLTYPTPQIATWISLRYADKAEKGEASERIARFLQGGLPRPVSVSTT